MSTKTSAGRTSKGASPTAAAGYLAAIVYIWLEAILRIILTNTMLLANFMLWNYRVGDIAAMWLTMSVVAIIVFVLAAYGFRSRTNVGSITFWTALLVISIIIAPLLGELGTPNGI
jgi:FtsH-binding integral membrane protein